MSDFKVGDEVWMWGFMNGDMIGFSPKHLVIDSVLLNQEPNTLFKGVALFKSKQEAIDAMIAHVEELKEITDAN